MKRITEEDLATWLGNHPHWSGTTQAITCERTFADFIAAMAFMQACIEPIEALQHHPEWSNVYNRLTIRLTTHDAGNVVTDKDLTLAEELDTIP